MYRDRPSRRETNESRVHKSTILPDGLAGNNIATPGVGAVITIFLAGLAITSEAIEWLYLLVRKTLLLVAIVFAPLALSGSSWDATRGGSANGRCSWSR